MPTECIAYPLRPPRCEFSNIAGLFLEFEKLFLSSGALLESDCGQKISIFDHHFFHLAAVRTESNQRLYMRDEKSVIAATTDGFGKYILDHSGSRARHLPSAQVAMLHPDEVWTDNPKAKSATWVYVKQFSSKPYPFTVAFLTLRPDEGGLIVPVSSFPCKRSDVKKWRQANCIYQRHVQPPCGG